MRYRVLIHGQWLSAVAGLAMALWCAPVSAKPTTPPAPVWVIRGDGDRGPFVGVVKAALRRAGISFATFTEAQLADHALSPATTEVVVVPYGARMESTTETRLLDYVVGGGRVFAFFKIPPLLAAALGVSLGQFETDDGRGRFASIRFTRDTQVLCLPDEMEQNSWNIFETTPIAAIPVGSWRTRRGELTGEDAVFLSQHGLFMNHVLTSDDLQHKAEFLIAAAGHFEPAVWKRADAVLARRWERSIPYGAIAQLREQLRILQKKPDGRRRTKRAREVLHRALETRAAATGRMTRDPAGAHRLWMQALAAIRSVRYTMLASEAVEMRGVFVPSLFVSPDWEHVMRQLRRNGLNAVFVHVGGVGGVGYPSKLLHVMPGLAGGEDPLKECLVAAKKHGIQVHAWFDVLNATSLPTGLLGAWKAQGRVITGPEPGAQQMLCPSVLANRKLAVDAIAELVHSYPLDGMMLDYLRLPFDPKRDYCYCDACRQAFATATSIGDEEWPKSVQPGGAHRADFVTWRADNITALLREIRLAVHRVCGDHPPVLSVGTFGWAGARAKVGQDAAAWLAKRIIDVHPNLNFTASDQLYQKLIEQQVEESGGALVYSGIGAFSHAAQLWTPEQLVRQVEIGRHAGAKGFVIYKLNATLRDEFLPALALGLTAQPANIPRR